MGKLQEYRKLSKNVRAARRNLHEVQLKITKIIETPDWSEYGVVKACINQYHKMIMPWFSKSSFEDVAFVKYCDRFNCRKVCQKDDCEYVQRNWDAVVAQIAYDDARRARREFIFGGLRKHEK